MRITGIRVDGNSSPAGACLEAESRADRKRRETGPRASREAAASVSHQRAASVTEGRLHGSRFGGLRLHLG
jgi:hypothetical protein